MALKDDHAWPGENMMEGSTAMRRTMCQWLMVTIVMGLISGVASAKQLDIVNLRVGQGDATLIQGPADDSGNRITVLFDAGDIPKRDGGDIIRAVLYKRGVRQLDFVIISHDDADHLGGIARGGVHGESLLLGFNDVPGAVGDDDEDGVTDWIQDDPIFEPDPEELGRGDDVRVMAFVDYGDAEMRSNTVAIKKYQRFAKAVPQRIVIDDQQDVNSFVIDLGDGATMTCYAGNGFVRNRATRVAHVNTPNEKSLSFLLTWGEFDYLISGDLIGRKIDPTSSSDENAHVEEAVGHAIVDAGRQVDVLHVNHHGANNASDAEFLRLIHPRIAIISAGNKNSHAHPSNDVLARLVEAGVYRIFQTSWGSTKEKIPEKVRAVQAIFGSIPENGQNDPFPVRNSFF